MRKTTSFILISLVLIFAACASPQQGGTGPGQLPYATPFYPSSAAEFAAQATIAARGAQDTAATFEAVRARETAASLQLTRQSEAATAQAASIATGTAIAYAGARAATSDALSFRSTEQAQTIESTRAAAVIGATVTAQARIDAFEATLASDESRRLDLLRQSEALANDAQRAWNVAWPLLLAAAVLFGAFAGFVYLANWWRHQEPVIEVNGHGRVLVSGNNFHILPPQLEAPRRPQLPVPTWGEDEEEEGLGDGNVILLPEYKKGHVLIAGDTGSGKTTALAAVLRGRNNVVVLDPHNEPHKWNGHQVIGGGRNFTDIAAYVETMHNVLDERYVSHNLGIRDFSALTVAIDEMPAIISKIEDNLSEVWREWLREGRKVGLYLVVATHSTRVRTLGIEGEGDLLINFDCTITLGDVARERHRELTHGLGRWPAVIESRGDARPVRIPQLPRSIPGPGPGLGLSPEVVAGSSSENGARIRPLDTPHGIISVAQQARILQLKRAGWSNRRIETEVFDQEVPGGAAYHKVKAVLDAHAAGVAIPVE